MCQYFALILVCGSLSVSSIAQASRTRKFEWDLATRAHTPKPAVPLVMKKASHREVCLEQQLAKRSPIPCWLNLYVRQDYLAAAAGVIVEHVAVLGDISLVSEMHSLTDDLFCNGIHCVLQKAVSNQRTT